MACDQRGKWSECSKRTQFQGRQANGCRCIAPGGLGFGEGRTHGNDMAAFLQAPGQGVEVWPYLDLATVQSRRGGCDQYELALLQPGCVYRLHGFGAVSVCKPQP